jgi:hypothetical protein
VLTGEILWLVEATWGPSGRVAPHNIILRKRGEGGEGMPVATSNRPEHSLLMVAAAASIVAWHYRQSRTDGEGK